MKKVSEYLEHAQECRLMARSAKESSHKEQLENMAATWDSLAAARRKQLARQGISEDKDRGQDLSLK